MVFDNEMRVSFISKSQNESFARVVVATFVSELDPYVSDITDIKTAISEAVTNAIIHGYDEKEGVVEIFVGISGLDVYIEVSDKGKGIKNIEQARTPLYTGKPEMERSGIGFTVMETFMDEISVYSKEDEGTTIKMTKRLAR